MSDKEIHFRGIPENLYGALQDNVLTLLAMSERYCKIVMGAVEPGLFSNRVVRDIVTQCYTFIGKHGKAPGQHLLDLVEDKLEGEEAEVYRDQLSMIDKLWTDGFNEEFVANQLLKFVKGQHLRLTTKTMIECAEKGDTDKADEVASEYAKMSFEQFNPGLTLLEAAKQLGREDRSRPIVTYGIHELDRNELGPARQELTLFLAPPKRGKTWFMLHVAKQSFLQRLRVAYVTLEMKPQLLAGRLFQSLFGMKKRDDDEAKAGVIEVDKKGRLSGLSSEILVKRLALDSEKGRKRVQRSFGIDGATMQQIGRLSRNLVIQSFPTGMLSMRQLEGYLDNLVTFQHFQPDVLIVDYADLMHVDTRNYRLNLGLLYKDLRGLAVDRNLALVTASQSNRASLDATTVTEKHAAEDFSKIAISDVVFTYNQTEVERQLQVARLFVAVARNGPDKWQVGISQAYSIGQFYTKSIDVPPSEWRELLSKNKAADEGAREDDDDEEDK